MGKRSILLIDDDEVVLKSVNNILVQEGYQVSLADSGESGLELFEKGEYPLVITDLVMGGMSGVEVVRRLKQTRPETMALVITGCGEFPPTVEAMAEGADDYLLKPCERSELVQKVADCFAKLERKW